MKNTAKILLILAGTLTLAGCVTTKKKGEDVSKFKKGYHNLTSKYNYWFNANELFYLTVDNLESQHVDNYAQLLDLYPYAAVDPQGSKGDLDNVIKKSSMAIGLHRVSDFTDDCYTLIGQAQYLKRDYESAESTFRYIREEYNPKSKTKMKKDKDKKKKKKKKSSKKKKKKKKKKKSSKKKKKKDARKKKSKKDDKKDDKKDEQSSAKPKAPEPPVVNTNNPYDPGIKRVAAYPTAMIWYARTLIDREKFDEAEFLIRELWDDYWFPESLKKDLSMAEAYLWLKQKRYERAIDPLARAIQLTEKKKERARLAYILSQLYERSGQFQEAYAALETVLKSVPSYDMEFNARLHQIQAGWTNGQMSSKEANQALEKMAKDEKNYEYRDQIYYVMADIALGDGDKKEAIAYLKTSLNYNQSNNNQRSESYLKLADLYFNADDFVKAKLYYDSTMAVLPNNDPRFSRVQEYAKNLTEISRLIQTIAQNDSIIRIFYMDDAERLELAKKIKKEQEEAALAAAEKAAAAAAAASADGAKSKNPNLLLPAGVKPSTFYFYNEAFLKKGKKDFSRLWGDRKLEDNWRRSNRFGASAGIDDVAGIKSDTSTNQNKIQEVDLGDVFQGLPQSEAELAVLHASNYESMYQLGTLFRDKLQNNQRCSGTLEDMQQRYQDSTKYEKETWYYCYLAFKDLNNMDRAKFYLDKLSAKYPNSPFTRSITDPNFLNATKEKERELNDYYEQTFTLFQKGEYKSAFDRCVDAPKKYGSTNPLMPKFSLISALCVGNLQGQDDYCKALSEVIARYPDSDESTRAKEIARLMECKGFEVEASAGVTERPVDNNFTLDNDKLHYFLVVLRGEVNMNDVKIAISDYNREYHRLEQLRISNIFLGTDTSTPIIVIRKFDNKASAMQYYQEVSRQNSFLGETGGVSYNKEFFAVTQENYRRILKNRSLDGYKEFFEENYMK